MSSTNTSLFSDDTSKSAALPKLGSSITYSNWAFTLKLYFISEGLWGIVSGTEPRPLPTPAVVVPSTEAGGGSTTVSEEDHSKVQSWDKRNATAFMTITVAITQSQMVHVVSKDLAKEAWDALEKVHRKEGQAALYTLLTRLVTARFKDGDNLEEHVSTMVNTANELASINEPIPDHFLVVYLLHSLPQSWETVVSMIELVAGETKPSLTSIIAQILKEGERRKTNVDASTVKKPNPGALAAQSHPRTGRPSRDKRQDTCYNCGKKGHHSHKCRSPRKEVEAKTVVKKNHYSLSVITIGTAFRTLSTPEEETWIVDSGADCHYSGRKEHLLNFVKSPIKVALGVGTDVCPGYRSLQLRLANGNVLDLDKVYYLPGAPTSLLSVKRLASHGATVTFGPDLLATITKDGDLVANTIPGTCYQLDVSPSLALANIVTPVPLGPLAATTRDAGSASLMAWHRRLGHISLDTIISLARSEAVKGLTLTDTVKRDCEVCLLSKSRRSPFSAISTDAPHTLYRLFIDLGFVNEPDFEGNRIYLAIVDQYSTAKWTFILSSKRSEEVLERWIEFKNNAERMIGQKIRFVRSDNGGEFISTKFIDTLRESGITYERTAAYTPEQNGQVERFNGAVISLVKAMLKGSGLPKTYWSLALSAATFYLNRIPHPRFNGKTAYEVALGKKPSVKHLRPFGTPCFTHIDSSLRSKLDDTAVRGIFVGYDGEYNYLVRLEDGKQITSRHVRFADAEFGFEELRLDLSLDDFSTPTPSQQLPPPSSDTIDKPDAPKTIKKDGYEYVQVQAGPNPGRFEEINSSNIIEGTRTRRRGAPTASFVSSEEPVYVKLVQVIDIDGMEKEEGIWEEEALMVGVVQAEVPRTHEEAMVSKDRVRWREAEEKEWSAFEENGVLQLALLPAGARALGTTWVYTVKTDEDGKVIRFKARLVAQGFGQRYGIDFNETFAAVSRMSTARFLIAYAASNGFNIESFDYETAFLNGTMTEDVYIKIPPGYPGKHQPGQVLKLIKAMYGTKQAPREWAKALNTLMIEHGYSQSKSDTCLYYKNVGGSLVIVLLYVDDGLIVASDASIIKQELESFGKVYKLKKLGRVSTFLSLQFAHTGSGIFIHQQKYIDSILSRYFDSLSRSPSATPMEDKFVLDPSSPLFSDVPLYQSAVGSLQYAAQLTRPDIAAAVRRVAQAVSAPTDQDWQAVKRIFRYLVGTKDYGIRYLKEGSLELKVFSDASWADDQENRRSVGAFVVLIAGGVVAWRCKQQTLIATSTTESELVAVSDATKEVLATRQLCYELEIDQPSATTIFEDNQACIAIAQSPGQHGRTKHFDVITLFVQERVSIGDVKLEYCRTEEMTADALTKGLGKTLFAKHRQGLGMVSLSSWISGSVGE
ncbi:uncharacterized protein JCM6883_007482 [Sporobolomyces salmoneus]|uniref:uncharacterized protein n=1 Tax=Sporobolomyces salmoneus TaxID=183962 RepID=UPI003177252A